MSIVTKAFVAVLALCSIAPAAFAGTMPQASVDYSADSIMEAQGMAINSRIYHSRNKDRMEMNTSGMNSIVINRMDKKLTWMLMPEQKMYTEMDIKEGKKNSKDISDCQVDFKSQGSETVNGFKTTKNKVTMVCPDNLTYTGHMWVTKESILMKMDAVATTDNGEVAFKMELKNLKIARQNPKLFEIPAGYEKMSLGGLFRGFVTPAQSRRGVVDKLVIGDEGRSYTAKPRKSKDRRGRSYTAAPRDNGRSYTAEPRRGRSYTAKPRDEGRSYTAAPRDEGRSYTAEPRDTGRSYTARKRSNPLDDPVGKIRNFFGL